MPRKAIGSRLLNLWARSPWVEVTGPPLLTRKTLPRINHDEIRIIAECAMRIAEQEIRIPRSAICNPATAAVDHFSVLSGVPGTLGVIPGDHDALLPGERSRAPERIAKRAEVA